MGVYIPNMEMPKSCWGCELLSSCKAMPKNPTVEEIGTYTIMRLKDCPLIEIVRCKECKWCDTGINEEGKLFWKCLGIHYGGTRPTDFCSYGERRSDPNNCKGCELTKECGHHICLKEVRERKTDVDRKAETDM